MRNPAVVRFCQEKGVEVIPGVATPSEIEQAIGLGLDLVKFFPAEALGGPYKNVRFIPTGGVNADNMGAYFACPQVAACGGSFMLGPFADRKEWNEIAARCSADRSVCAREKDRRMDAQDRR